MLDTGERALALVISLIEKLGYRWCEEHLEVFKDRCPICHAIDAIDNQEDCGDIAMVLDDAIDKLNTLHARAPLLSLLTVEQVS